MPEPRFDYETEMRGVVDQGGAEYARRIVNERIPEIGIENVARECVESMAIKLLDKMTADAVVTVLTGGSVADVQRKGDEAARIVFPDEPVFEKLTKKVEEAFWERMESHKDDDELEVVTTFETVRLIGHIGIFVRFVWSKKGSTTGATGPFGSAALRCERITSVSSSSSARCSGIRSLFTSAIRLFVFAPATCAGGVRRRTWRT